jgi:hypothetical protein
MSNTNERETMNSTTEHKPVKTSSRTDAQGMSHSTWTYRGVTLKYRQTTKNLSPWEVHVDGKKDWWSLIGDNKAEIMERIDTFLAKGYLAKNGKLRHPER